MYGDAAEIDERKLRFEGAAHHVMRDAVLVTDCLSWRSGRHAFGRLLLVKAFASHSIRTALEREQVALHIRAKFREDGLVTLRQIEFRVTFVGPKNLVRMRDPLERASVARFGSASARGHV